MFGLIFNIYLSFMTFVVDGDEPCEKTPQKVSNL